MLKVYPPPEAGGVHYGEVTGSIGFWLDQCVHPLMTSYLMRRPFLVGGSKVSVCVCEKGNGLGSLKAISCPGPFLLLLPGHYNLNNWFSPIFCRPAVLSLQGPLPWNKPWNLRYHEPGETSHLSILRLTSFVTAVKVSAQADPVSALANVLGSDPGFVIGL